MPISESDPRVFFAAERTLLAWLRTGLTIMALGFVVARFGLFLHLLAQSQRPSLADHTSLSAALGVAFVIAGTLAIVLAAAQYWRFVATLPQSDVPRAYSRVFAFLLSLLMGALGMALVCYLLFAQR